jgi:hypothetical protein
MNPLLILSLLPLAALCSCAGYSITPVSPVSKWADAGEGYRIYEPKPYLRVAVTQTDKGPVYSADLTYLPNLARPYQIRTWAHFSKAEFQFAIEKGWMLTGVNSKLDTTDVPKAIVDLAKGIFPADVSNPRPYVAHFYEVKIDGEGITVDPKPSFTVAVPAEEAKREDTKKEDTKEADAKNEDVKK